MKLKVFAASITVFSLALLGASVSQADDVAYRGETRAASICRAIVEDNPSKMQLHLNKAARENRGTTIGRINRESFQCNGQDLDDFAREVNAGKTVAYLSGESSEVVAQN